MVRNSLYKPFQVKPHIYFMNVQLQAIYLGHSFQVPKKICRKTNSDRQGEQ